MKVNSKSGLKLPKMEIIENSHVPTLVSTFPSLHSYLINSISTAYNEEVILSSDDLRVYLWNLEKPSKAFEVVDLKPDNIDEVSEVIFKFKNYFKYFLNIKILIAFLISFQIFLYLNLFNFDLKFSYLLNSIFFSIIKKTR